MATLQNYIQGHWVSGSGEATPQYHALTGEVVNTYQSEGLDYGAILDYARVIGNPALRKLTFQERGRMLKALALYLMDRKAHYYQVSHMTGATRADSWVDIEGGIGNLFANASLRRRFPNETYHVEGETIRLSKENTFVGHHILTPSAGWRCTSMPSISRSGECLKK
jgi:oxepin-CoA hydrolase/3-oxo-5,6-dehydrosuberyl-CoA semialdehyde dehydrogenase